MQNNRTPFPGFLGFMLSYIKTHIVKIPLVSNKCFSELKKIQFGNFIFGSNFYKAFQDFTSFHSKKQRFFVDQKLEQLARDRVM